jgi:hypothetical protein
VYANLGGSVVDITGDFTDPAVIHVTPTVSLTATNSTYTGSAYTGAVVAANVGGGYGTTTIYYYASLDAATANAGGTTDAPTDAGTYYARAFYVSDGLPHDNTIYDNASSSVVSFAIAALSLDNFTTASVQAALNVAKQGTVSFALNVNATGIVDGQTVAQLFNNATFTLSMAGESATYEGTATVIDNVVYVNINLKNNGDFYNFLCQGLDTGETSASKANWESITLSASSIDGNYTIGEEVSTRIFKSSK